MRDLPMPGSPEISTTWPSPALARAQRRNSRSISSSRPTSGVSADPRNASNRLATTLGRSTCQAGTGAAMPLTSTAPRSRYSKRSPTSRRVPAAMTTASGSARACRRAARFGVSPTTDCSCAEPSPIRSPTTTSPVAIPTRAWSLTDLTSRRPTASIDAQPRPDRPLGIVLMRLRVAEIDQHAVAHVFGDKAVELGDDFGDGAVIRGDDLAQILGIEPRRQRGRADQVAEHHRQLPAFGIGRSRCIARCAITVRRRPALRRRARRSRRAACGDARPR